MKKILPFVTVLHIGLWSAQGHAAGIYSFDQINRYWQDQVGHPSNADRGAYQSLTSEKFEQKAIEMPEVDDEEPPPELLGRGSFESIVVAAGSADTPTIRVLPVLPARAETGRVLRREALLQSYLRKYELFTGTFDSAEQPAVLERRLNQAQLELYLSSMIRMAQARSLAGKCQSVTQAQTLDQALSNRRKLFGGLVLDSESTWLLEAYDNVQRQYQLEDLNRLLCQTRVITTNAELIQLIKAKVARKLSENELLGGYAERKTSELQTTLRTYTDLANELSTSDYSINVERLIKLRDDLSNIKSNFDLVKDDSYCLSIKSVVCTSNRLDQLKSIDFSRIAKFDGPDDPVEQAKQSYERVMNSRENTIGLDAIFARYEAFASTAPLEFRPTMAPCASIVTKYKGVEQLSIKGAGQDTLNERRAFKAALMQCLDAAVDAFKKSAASNQAQYRIDDALAGYVSRLSEIVLERKK